MGRRERRRAGRRAAKLSSHGTRPKLVRKSVFSYSLWVAGAGCRAECFGHRPSCLLNQPPPTCQKWGPVVTAPALGGWAPLLKPPPSPCASALPAQGFLLAAVRDCEMGHEAWSACSRGPPAPGVVPGQKLRGGGLEKEQHGASSRDTVAQVGLRGGSKAVTGEGTPQRLGPKHRGLSQSPRVLGPSWRWELRVGQGPGRTECFE